MPSYLDWNSRFALAGSVASGVYLTSLCLSLQFSTRQVIVLCPYRVVGEEGMNEFNIENTENGTQYVVSAE